MTWIKNLKTSNKLFFLFSIMLISMLAIGIYSYSSFTDVGKRFDEIFYTKLPSLDYLIEADRDFHQMIVAERSMIITNVQSDIFQDFLKLYNENVEQSKERFEKYKALATSPQEQAIITKLEVVYHDWLLLSQQVVDNRKADTREGRRFAIDLTLTKAKEKFDLVHEYIDQLTELNLKLAGVAHAESTKIHTSTKQVIIAIILISIGLGIFITLLISRAINIPLKKIGDVARSIAKGDVSDEINIYQKDEIGELAESFRTMSGTLKEKANIAEQISLGNLAIEIPVKSRMDVLGNAMVTLKESTARMAEDVKKLATSALEGHLQDRAGLEGHHGEFRTIISGINETLDAVSIPLNSASEVLQRVANKDISRRMEGEFRGEFLKIKIALNSAIDNLGEGFYNIRQSTMQIDSASEQISRNSQTSAESASEEAASIQEITSSLHEITSNTKKNAQSAIQAKDLSITASDVTNVGVSSMEKLSNVIEQIKSSADETANIVKTIDDIAFQTNLLALNAAVEAARAGEAGKGFSVVAEEVRNLAMRSAEAARNTSELIQESVNNAENGVKMNSQVVTSLKDINTHVAGLTQVLEEIADASQRQTEGLTQISTTVEQLNSTTQQNAANSEELASTAEQLSAQSKNMRHFVGQYQLSHLAGSFVDNSLHSKHKETSP